MDVESLIQSYLFLSTESESGAPVNTSFNPAFPPQGIPILDRVWLDSWSLDIPDPQVHAESSILVGCRAPSYPLIRMFIVQLYSAGFRPSIHSTILTTGPAAETFHPEALVAASDIRDKDLPVSNLTHPSETSVGVLSRSFRTI